MLIWWYHYESDKFYYTSRYVIVILVSIKPLIDDAFFDVMYVYTITSYTQETIAAIEMLTSLVTITKYRSSSLDTFHGYYKTWVLFTSSRSMNQ
jgi:hypothetical protein